MTQLWAEQKNQSFEYDVLNLAVMPEERKTLHERIALRYKIMLKEGFVDEVKALHQRGDLNTHMPSVRCVGYRQVWSYLEDEWDHDTMVEKGIIATRQLAKRQITWLRSWENLHWLKSEDKDILSHSLKLFDSTII